MWPEDTYGDLSLCLLILLSDHFRAFLQNNPESVEVALEPSVPYVNCFSPVRRSLQHNTATGVQQERILPKCFASVLA